ncbi:hypothetical protein CesoFtcFv8_013401 [Champsocephalus esox]|uniref:Uncharacterized protein n=1 Tax=Champsocephalus esox TaxID=159716 RepID=A0AAN8BT14_9TELE|nr:hypothetical protein CesoFtcFv8_013401 [Champsocephalus esox]
MSVAVTVATDRGRYRNAAASACHNGRDRSWAAQPRGAKFNPAETTRPDDVAKREPLRAALKTRETNRRELSKSAGLASARFRARERRKQSKLVASEGGACSTCERRAKMTVAGLRKHERERRAAERRQFSKMKASRRRVTEERTRPRESKERRKGRGKGSEYVGAQRAGGESSQVTKEE